MQNMIVSYDHCIVTSEKVRFKRLKSKESSEFLKLVVCFLAMVCCRTKKVKGKLNASRDYLLIQLHKTHLCNKEGVSRRYISGHLHHVHNSCFLLPKEHVQPLILQPISITDCSALSTPALKGQQTLKRKRHI